MVAKIGLRCCVKVFRSRGEYFYYIHRSLEVVYLGAKKEARVYAENLCNNG